MGASTGSLPAVRDLLGLRSFTPQTASVRAARRFVQACLTGTPLEPLADDAGLLVCELAANAVLHARTDFAVAVCELRDGAGTRVVVRDDAAALPTVTAPSATAMSGRGMALVQTLASRWGAGPSSSARKGVWFELDLTTGAGGGAGGGHPLTGEDPTGGGGPDLTVEELLAAWRDDEQPPVVAASAPEDPDGSHLEHEDGRAAAGAAVAREVVLPPLDAADLLAAKESMDDLLRELQLMLLDERAPDGPSADDLELARRLDVAARGFDSVRRQVRQQVSLAVAAGERSVRLRLLLPVGTWSAATDYLTAVEAAEDLAERGTLLATGARLLRRHHAVRRAYLGEIIAAAGS